MTRLQDTAVGTVTRLQDTAFGTVTMLQDTAVGTMTMLQDTAAGTVTRLQDTAVGTDWGAGQTIDDYSPHYRQGQQGFLTSTDYRPASEPTQPPTQRVVWDLSPRVGMGVRTAGGCESDHSPLNGADVWDLCRFTPYSPACLHGVHWDTFPFVYEKVKEGPCFSQACLTP